MMDPQMKKEYKGIDGTPGFVSAWESDNKKVGKGEQQLTKLTEGQRVDYDIHFIKPFEGMANACMKTEGIPGNAANVKWGFSSAMKYPMNIMLLFMNIPEMLAKDLQTGLANLKNVLEK